ncbi:hypothetical protein [Roseicella aerolata]|uniref:Uncharacterized protein n=1 Tax=Roseicella aerolata TaxID=2883479 RepID=A0A9X1II48_9PROT|nr:hypothetical protein [Roseicella aerolata]MCB4825094.1 hypothetical protein [Roseicella aerolata]
MAPTEGRTQEATAMPRKTTQHPSHRRAEGKGTGSGTPADRLVRAWLDGKDDTFADLAEEFIAGGRDGVLSAALRKFAERYEEEAVEEFALALTELAEAVEGQAGFDLAELVLLPVATTGAPPDPARLAGSLAGAGLFPAEAEVIFAEGWHSAEAILSLSPVAIRRVLLDIAGRRPPADLPPLPATGEAEGGIAVLVGALAFGTAPSQEEPAPPATGAAGEEEFSDAFERWHASLDPTLIGDAVILSPCSPSQLADEIEALLEEANEAAFEEVADFIDTAREEAAGEEVVARLAERSDGVEVTLLTRAGRELDRRVFDTAEGELTAEDIRRVVGDRIPILDDTA